MFSRRDLLRFFGISTTCLSLPSVLRGTTSEKKTTFDMKNFECWLKATSKSIQENKLSSFIIRVDKEHLNINGVADGFLNNFKEIESRQEQYFKERDEYVKASDLEKAWLRKNRHRDNKGRFAKSKPIIPPTEPLLLSGEKFSSQNVSFQLSADKAPVNFMERIKTKHGRLNFVKMCHNGMLNNIKDVGTYLIACQDASAKEMKERFKSERDKNGNWKSV